MRLPGNLLALAAGVGIGVAAAVVALDQPKPAGAASNDRYQDYVMATGAVSLNPRVQSDGVWLLDYRSGKLLGTVIDKGQGKIVGWAEVDLVGEFEIAPRADVHFMMTTGYITQGQSALYVAETTTGKFGVYTMGPGINGNGVTIRRHDLTSFRKTAEPAAAPCAGSGADAGTSGDPTEGRELSDEATPEDPGICRGLRVFPGPVYHSRGVALLPFVSDDRHGHLHVVSTNLPGTGTLHKLLTESPEAVAASLKEAMRSAGITAAFAMPEWNAPDGDPLGIAKTLRVAELVPGLWPIGVADPVRGDDPEHLKRVETILTRGRVAALKCYLGYLHYEPAHPNYRRYYELAAQFKLPVVFHTGDTYSPQAKLKYAHPLGVDEVAVDHPDTRFVLAHAGNPWMTDAAEVIYKNLNVWADLSGLVVGDETAFAAEENREALADLGREVRRAFRYAERPNRFVFGTDWPLAPIAPYKQFVASVIPAAYHPQVFEENARVLFRGLV